MKYWSLLNYLERMCNWLKKKLSFLLFAINACYDPHHHTIISLIEILFFSRPNKKKHLCDDIREQNMWHSEIETLEAEKGKKWYWKPLYRMSDLVRTKTHETIGIIYKMCRNLRNYYLRKNVLHNFFGCFLFSFHYVPNSQDTWIQLLGRTFFAHFYFLIMGIL